MAASCSPALAHARASCCAASSSLDWPTLAAAAAQGITLVIYMGIATIEALQAGLLEGLAADTPVAVVSRAGWPDRHGSDHRVDTLPEACVLHGGRPTVVIVGVGASALAHDGAAVAQNATSPLPLSPLPPLAAGSKP